MTDETKADINQTVQKAAAWIGIGGAVFAVLSFCMMLGMWFGPLKDMPAQFSMIVSQLNDIKGRMDKTDWAMETVKTRQDALASQLLASAEDRSKLWESVRRIETTAAQLKSGTVTREELIEWGSALGNRNKTLSIPSLTRHSE